MTSVPRRIMWQLEKQIEAKRASINKALAQLAQMEAVDTNYNKAKGGYARAASMSPKQRTEFARKGASARWKAKPQ